MEIITLPHLGQYQLFMALFLDVSNTDFLRQQLLSANTDYEYAFLDATMIASRDHLLAACFRSVNDLRASRLKSRNVHSEIVFALSPNNNIAESFRRFGLNEKTKHVIAIKVARVFDTDIDATTSPTLDEVATHLTANVKGNQTALTDPALADLCNKPALKKLYKTLDVPSILGIMAVKGT